MQQILVDSEIFCAMELDKSHKVWVVKMGLNAEVFPKEDLVDSSLLAWLKKIIGRDNPKDFLYFLSGNADTVRYLRRFLVKQIIDSKQVFVHTYWKEGNKGL